MPIPFTPPSPAAGRTQRLPASWQLLTVLFAVLLLIPPCAAASDKEFEIALTKGSMALEDQSTGEAIRLFNEAVRLRPQSAQAQLLLGMALARDGSLVKARSTLLQALRLAPEEPRIRLELAQVLARQGEVAEARDLLQDVLDGPASPELKQTAQAMLTNLGSTARAERRLQIDLTAGLQYDSNVLLEPSNPLVRQDHRGDWRELFQARARVAALRTPVASSEIGYSFYQSFHNRLDDFNIQQHKLELTGRLHPERTFRATFGYSLSRTLLNGDLYATTHGFGPQLTLQTRPWLVSQLHARREVRKYFNTSSFSGNSARSGEFDSVGLSEYLRLGKLGTLAASYSVERDKTEQSHWRYRGRQGRLAYHAEYGSWQLQLSGTYLRRNYAGLYPGFGSARLDRAQEYAASLRWAFSPRWSLSLSELYVINDSNLDLFDYKRNIFGLILGVSL